ncbi:uncharacterized protein LOC117015595 [Rhinolophus ferrumequinum]|uniref:uncharacterized protein LOC117015595 n=1 Tax=Rhinolophus ferrumequinum TaxID=59479 RepID=UPI00140FEAE2|nr:uncharacterized protein LOC117015595 [Rhinolophus ferrumequinum]
MESEPFSTNTFEFPRRYCRGLLLVGAGQVEASAVIGWCASAPPLPLRPASPAPEGSSPDLHLRSASVRVRWLSAGTPPAPGAGFPALSSLTRASLFRGGSHSWVESPVERITGAETLLSASGPKRILRRTPMPVTIDMSELGLSAPLPPSLSQVRAQVSSGKGHFSSKLHGCGALISGFVIQDNKMSFISILTCSMTRGDQGDMTTKCNVVLNPGTERRH